MNKKLIALIAIILTATTLSATYYLDDNGRWYSYDKKTGKREELSSEENVSDPQYRERNYPYQRKSDSRSLDTFRRYDATHNNMGNESWKQWIK